MKPMLIFALLITLLSLACAPALTTTSPEPTASPTATPSKPTVTPTVTPSPTPMPPPAVANLTDCITKLWNIRQGTPKPDQEAQDRLRKCLTFELKFQSQVDMSGAQGGRYKGTAESTIRLQLDPADFTIKGHAPLNLPSASWEVPGCSTNTTTAPGTFEVFELDFIVLLVPLVLPADEVAVDDLRLVYNPGGHDATRAIETSTWTCPDVGTFTIPGPFWLSGYAIPHQNEMSAEGFVATEWRILGRQEYARKEWSTTGEAGAAITESGYFILYHRPEE